MYIFLKPHRRLAMFKFITLLFVSLAFIFVTRVSDSFCGVNYKDISPTKRIIHMLTYAWSGIILYITIAWAVG
jgi:hypothetical protein